MRQVSGPGKALCAGVWILSASPRAITLFESLTALTQGPVTQAALWLWQLSGISHTSKNLFWVLTYTGPATVISLSTFFTWKTLPGRKQLRLLRLPRNPTVLQPPGLTAYLWALPAQ